MGAELPARVRVCADRPSESADAGAVVQRSERDGVPERLLDCHDQLDRTQRIPASLEEALVDLDVAPQRHGEQLRERPFELVAWGRTDAWPRATAWGERAPIDLADGYIHLSTRDQLTETVDKHFAGQADLWVAAIDLNALGDSVKWEESRGGALFPHYYGRLPVASASWERKLEMSPSGSHIMQDEWFVC